MTTEERQTLIDRIRRFPDELAALVRPLSEEQLHARTIDGEWTVQQIVHHMPDSHMSSYIRLRLILTEDAPPLKPYDQDKWAELPDVAQCSIETSLDILRGLHARWCVLLEALTEEQRMRTGHTPSGSVWTPDRIVQVYANHCDEHIDQIQRTLAAGNFA